MRVIRDAGAVRYGLLDAGDAQAMARLLGETFSERDPPAVVLRLSAAEIENIVSLVIPKALEEDLTVVATTVAGELVGAMLSDDIATLPPDMTSAPAAFGPLGAMLDELEIEYRRDRQVVPGRDLHLAMLGVTEAYAGRGIARTLVELCVENGARRGYRSAFAQSTGRTSQHIFRKAGFEERGRVAYGDFEFAGRRVFEPIAAEHRAALLMVRDLS